MAFGSLLGRSIRVLVSFLLSAMSQSHLMEGFESSEFFVHLHLSGIATCSVFPSAPHPGAA